jgi:hypothetical protein
MSSLKIIETFFSDYKFEENVLKLNGCTDITDLKKFVNSQIHLLKNNSGKKVYLPYFYRLEQVYLKLKNNEQDNKRK